MKAAELWKLIDLKLQSTKELTDFIQDANIAELNIIHPNDLIDKKKLKVAACKIVRKKLTEIYALTDKIEEREREDIINIENMIDESML